MSIVLYLLATWRVTHLLIKENGPFNVFGHIRAKLGVDEEDGSYRYEITVCYYCLSIWVGLVLLFVPWQFNLVMSASVVTIWLWPKLAR